MNLPTHVVAVGGLVRNAQGLVLLVRHPRRGWEFPGGIVERGESLPQALRREIFEESGVQIEVVGLAGVYSNLSTRQGYDGVEEIPPIVNIDFLCAYAGGQPTPSAESPEVGWFTGEQALAMVTHPLLLHRLRHLLKADGSFSCDAFQMPFELTETWRFPVNPKVSEETS